MKDYYETLGVSPNSETEVITAAYKALMRKYHPDTNKSADAAAKAQEINEAYEVLKSPPRRREYDAMRGQTDSNTPPPRPPTPPSSPKTKSSDGDGWSSFFVTEKEAALRIWFIYAASFCLTKWLDDRNIIPTAIVLDGESSPGEVLGEVVGAALATFGLAYMASKLWQLLEAKPTSLRTQRFRWLWLQIPIVLLGSYQRAAHDNSSLNSNQAEAIAYGDERRSAPSDAETQHPITATNPETGERFVLTDNQWVPISETPPRPDPPARRSQRTAPEMADSEPNSLPPPPSASPTQPPTRARAAMRDGQNRWAARIASNYPRSAVQQYIEGNVGVSVIIGSDGRVATCSVTASSGSQDLDSAACESMRRHARYVPALDEAGNPTTGRDTMTIVYHLGE